MVLVWTGLGWSWVVLLRQGDVLVSPGVRMASRTGSATN